MRVTRTRSWDLMAGLGARGRGEWASGMSGGRGRNMLSGRSLVARIEWLSWRKNWPGRSYGRIATSVLGGWQDTVEDTRIDRPYTNLMGKRKYFVNVVYSVFLGSLFFCLVPSVNLPCPSLNAPNPYLAPAHFEAWIPSFCVFHSQFQFFSNLTPQR